MENWEWSGGGSFQFIAVFRYSSRKSR